MKGLIIAFGGSWICDRIRDTPHHEDDDVFAVKHLTKLEELAEWIRSGNDISSAFIDFGAFELAQDAFILLRCELPLTPVIAILPEREAITEQSLIEVGAGDVIAYADIDPVMLRRVVSLARIRNRQFYSKERNSVKSQAIRIVSSSIIALLKNEIRDVFANGEKTPQLIEKRALSVGSLLESLTEFLMSDQDLLEGDIETFTFEDIFTDFFDAKIRSNPQCKVSIKFNDTLPTLLRGLIKPTLKIVGLLYSAICEFTDHRGEIELRIFKEAQVGNEVKIFIRFLSGGLLSLNNQQDEHPMEVMTLITNDVLSRVGGGVFLEILSTEKTSVSLLVPFELQLPQVSSIDANTRPKSLAPVTAYRKTKCLVVDDITVNVRIGTSLLQRIGFATDVAYSGRQALHIASEDHFGFVLLDIDMPDMDGFEVCAKLREMPGYATSKIIAFSASRLTMDPELQAAGFTGCLPKPVIRAVLDEMTRDLP